MKRSIYLICLAIFVTLSAMSQTLPEPMKPARLVNDFAGIFTESQRQQLESNLVNFDNKTSTQIAVVTVSTLDGTSVSDYATKLFNKWGIGGDSKKNNGVLILIKPKTKQELGRTFITIGYGLEGAIPDVLTGRIIDNDMIPSFKTNDYFAGVAKAINTIESLAIGEFTAEQYVKKHEGKKGSGSIIFVIILIIFGLISAFSKNGRNGGETMSSSDSSSRALNGVLLASILLGGRGGGGGGGFGGFSGGGGGFGGFGGGFSGGGGAGGSW